MEVLSKNRLVINMKKCVFAKSKLEYLGHIISCEGVQADPTKITSMVNWPPPRNLRELRGFMGLTGYYRRFVVNYGKTAKPLTELLKKEAFHWRAEADEAFITLKRAMTILPVLAMPDFNIPFEVEADASGKGVGAVLMQKGRPIAYFSQGLSKKAQQCFVYERELMAIVLAVKKWRHYLLGNHFVIRTDQRALKFLLEQRVMDNEQQKWVSKLLGFKFEIVYKPGKENKAADALLQKVNNFELQGYSLYQAEGFLEWEEELKQDGKLAEILQQLITGTQVQEGFSLRKGCVLYKGRIAVPKHSSRKVAIIREFHDTPLGGHSGVLRTYKRVASLFH